MDQTSSYITFFTSTLSTCFLIRKFFPMGFGFFLSFFVHFCCSETCCFFVIPELRNMVIIKTWFDKIGYNFLLSFKKFMSFFRVVPRIPNSWLIWYSIVLTNRVKWWDEQLKGLEAVLLLSPLDSISTMKGKCLYKAPYCYLSLLSSLPFDG